MLGSVQHSPCPILAEIGKGLVNLQDAAKEDKWTEDRCPSSMKQHLYFKSRILGEQNPPCKLVEGYQGTANACLSVPEEDLKLIRVYTFQVCKTTFQVNYYLVVFRYSMKKRLLECPANAYLSISE